MLELPTYALSAHHHPEPHGHRTQLPRTLQRPPRHVATPQSHVQFAAQEVSFPTTTSRRQLVQEAAAVPSYGCCHVTQRTPINTNRAATTKRAWCCVANARSTKRERTAASSQRASAKKPTICGPPQTLALHGNICKSLFRAA